MKKAEILSILNTLPEEFSANEIIEKIQLVDGINKGLKAIEEGRMFDHEEVADIFKHKGRGKRIANFTGGQKRMLHEADQDIAHGRVITVEEMNETDLKWLNTQ